MTKDEHQSEDKEDNRDERADKDKHEYGACSCCHPEPPRPNASACVGQKTGRNVDALQELHSVAGIEH